MGSKYDPFYYAGWTTAQILASRSLVASWALRSGGTSSFLNASGTWTVPSGTGAPTNADYLVKTANGSLSAERVVTDTSTVTWDWATAGQAKANVPNLSGTNTGDQTISLTGDVTGSGTGSFAATISAGAVSLSKQADVASSTVFYRKTAGAGSPEVQTLSTLKTDLGLTGTNSGDQTISLTGDVTGSGTGSFAATIANSAVTLAKLANISDATMLGNNTGGSAAPVALTAAQIRTLLGLVIGTNVQAYDAELAAIAGLTSAANKIPRFTGSGTADLVDIAYGTYTPTLTDVSNTATRTANDSIPYLRIGSIVICAMNITLTMTAAASTSTTVRITLPIASNIGANRHACGYGGAMTTGNMPGGIFGDATNDEVRFEFLATTTSSTTFCGIFIYSVI